MESGPYCCCAAGGHRLRVWRTVLVSGPPYVENLDRVSHSSNFRVNYQYTMLVKSKSKTGELSFQRGKKKQTWLPCLILVISELLSSVRPFPALLSHCILFLCHAWGHLECNSIITILCYRKQIGLGLCLPWSCLVSVEKWLLLLHLGLLSNSHSSPDPKALEEFTKAKAG